jgi:transcriptional regulator with XRE-family HTH domain
MPHALTPTDQRRLRHLVDHLIERYGTAAALAEAIGKKPSTITRLMKKQSGGSVDLLRRLAQLAGGISGARSLMDTPVRLGDLDNFDEELARAKKVAEFGSDIWEEVSNTEAAPGQTKLTAQELILTAQFRVSLRLSQRP